MGSYFSFSYMLTSLPVLASYLSVSIFITIASALPGFALAIVFAIINDAGPKWFKMLYRIFISFFRCTPFIVQLFIVYFGIPQLLQHMGIDVSDLPPMIFIISIFVLHLIAYGSEILRGGIQAVASGEIEAGRSLGMTTAQTYLRIVIPQAFVMSIPPMMNEIISTLKSTALLFNVGVVDMMRQADLMGGNSQRYLELYVDVAILYSILILALTMGGHLLERHFNIMRSSKTNIGGIDNE